jgi:GNAT superfamily N-acetyltransferase
MTMVSRVSASEVYPIRQQVLRPDQAPEAAIYLGDELESTYHIGLFEAGSLVGIASLYPEGPEGYEMNDAWRLRGMAVLPEHHGRGFGSKLLQACMAYAATHGGTALWCNARIKARSFYEVRGLTIEGEVFDIPGIGPHFRMICPL